MRTKFGDTSAMRPIIQGPKAAPASPPAAKKAKSEDPAKGNRFAPLTTDPGQSKLLPKPLKIQATRLSMGKGLSAATK